MKPAMLKCMECGTRLNIRPASQTASPGQPVASRGTAGQIHNGTAVLKRALSTVKAPATSAAVQRRQSPASDDGLTRNEHSSVTSGSRLPAVGREDTVAATGTDQCVASDDAKPARIDSSCVCECPCGARFRFPPHMAGMRRRCRKCREPLLLPDGDPQSLVATAVVAVDADDVLQNAVAAAVARITSSDSVDNGRLGKTLSSRVLKDYSSHLASNDTFSQSDVERRRLIVFRIGQSNDSRGLKLIEPLKNDSWKIVRQTVATAIGELGDSRGVRLAIELLCDKDGDVVQAAIQSLKMLADARSIRPLMLVGLNKPLLRIQAMSAVVSIGSEGISELLEIIEERSPLTIGDSIIALGRIGDQRAVPSLLMTLNHADVGLRPKIVETLGLLGDRSALSRIVDLLADPDEKVQLNAIRAVQRIPDLRAVKPIIRILHRTQNTELRLQAVIALATSGSQKAVAILSALLPGADVALQRAIAEALGHINSPEASEVLVELLHAGDLSIVSKALAGMRKFPALTALPVLVELAGHPNVDIRRHTLEVLAEIKEGVSYEILEQRLLSDSSVEVRAAAARGLGRIGDRKAIPCLERALQEESAVRSAAVLALGVLGDDSVVPALLASLKDPIPEVRYQALSGLGKLKATSAVRSIRGMLEDSDEVVRLCAEKTLKSLGLKLSGISLARRLVSGASCLLPDGVAGVLPARTVLAGLAGSIAVLIIVWLAATSSTASMGSTLAVVRASSVTKALWLPGSSDVILLREDGPADVWDATTGRFKSKIDAPELESFGHPASLMSRVGETLTPWTLDGASANGRSIKLPSAKQFSLSANGAIAVYIDDAGKVGLWDTSEGTSIGSVELQPLPVPVISADGNLVAGADSEGNITIFKRRNGKLIDGAGEIGSTSLRELRASDRLIFCSEGNLLAVLRNDRIVLISAAEKGLESRNVDAVVHTRYVRFPNPSTMYKASGTFISRIDLTTGETQQWEITSDQVGINSLSLSPDETFAVVSADDQKTGWVLNLSDGTTHELSPAAWPAE
jgi:HEAT repeat protein